MDLSNNMTWIVSVSAVVILLTYVWSRRRDPKYPPTPLRSWPIVGNMLQLNPDPRAQFAGFRKQCGDIYSLYLGSTHVVVLNGFDVVKEAIIKQADDFSDRAVTFVDIVSDGVNRGIGSSSGAVWKEHRIFSTTVLRSFGLGKNILAEKIQEETNHFMELLTSYKGEPKDIQSALTISVSNIMCSMIVGNRYEYDDEEFQRMQNLLQFNLSKIKGTALLNFLPWLRFIPGDPLYCKIIEKNFNEFYDIFARVHIKENENVVGEPGNFIAAYLQEMKRKEEAGEKTYLDKKSLLRSILDLFVAGTETTATTLRWFFLYMINFPEVQEKIFQEINEVVGLERAPNMQDKSKLVYMTSVIMEIQRLASLIPLSGPRIATRDIDFRGYIIAKDTQIFVNFDSILHDKSLWGDEADVFKPERFIAADGSLLSLETWIPFSLGRRACPGESMAKMELFLFVSNIVQRFKICPADSKAVPPIKGQFGITHTPLPHELRMVLRR